MTRDCNLIGRLLNPEKIITFSSIHPCVLSIAPEDKLWLRAPSSLVSLNLLKPRNNFSSPDDESDCPCFSDFQVEWRLVLFLLILDEMNCGLLCVVVVRPAISSLFLYTVRWPFLYFKIQVHRPPKHHHALFLLCCWKGWVFLSFNHARIK